MSDPETSKQTQKKELFDLPLSQRKAEAARLVNEMAPLRVGQQNNEPWPVELTGDVEHTIAFMDLVYVSTPPEQLGMILDNPKGLRADKTLVKKLNDGSAFVPVQGKNRPTTILAVEGQGNGAFKCKFGYSTKGTTVERKSTGQISTDIYEHTELIVQESLYKLYKLTGNPNFIETIGQCAELIASGGKQSASEGVDTKGYYAILGFNPYALRFLDEEYFKDLVSGMKIKIAKKIHPDSSSRQPTEREVERFTKMMDACNVLENPEKRASYSSWLK